MNNVSLVLLVPAMAASLVFGCAQQPQPQPAAPAVPAPAVVEAAIAGAFAALARPEIDDPYEELFIDLAYRRFGRSEGKGAMAAFAMRANEPPQPDRRLMARWGDAALAFDGAAISSMERNNPNRGMIEAMYCRERPIPMDYIAYAQDAIAKGGYDLTHVLIGYAFAKEAGCSYPLSPAEVEAMVRATAAMIPGAAMTDLQMEAALILAWSDRKDLLPADTLSRILSVQWKNGGWGQGPTSKTADGHATMLALNLLLELTATPRGPVVAR